MWAYSERVSMFTSAEAVVANRGSILPPSESSLKEGVDEMSLSEQLAGALRGPERLWRAPTIRRSGDRGRQSRGCWHWWSTWTCPRGGTRGAAGAGAGTERQQDSLLRRHWPEGGEPAGDGGVPRLDQADGHRSRPPRGVFEPFIAYLEQSHLKHVNATRLMDLTTVRRSLHATEPV